ncbi:M56 family metallopeptidase [Paludibacter jiangxiensis]|uniref:Signal transducer regulating beta-lactamase production n=1 Tax=Paludibacter jiangxiensis TaxID=681398 RepID=A0A161LVE3_9BACT|nr:M56 family metallopeptidase [Paludibacter jiangxiensis]GAT63229.1 signal transducer regulating beta-lactamase production [Paludibacter jiangxiensis]
MAPFTLYLLKANGVFILLFAFYLLFLHRDTFYKAKRVYLLGIIVASALLPLLHPAALIPQKESVQYVILLVGDSLNNLARPETFSLSTMQLIDLLLCVGIAGSLLLLLFRYLQLWWVMRRCRVVCYGNQKVYVPAKELNPFSYQGRIFLNPELYTEEELVRIIRHEQAHIDQKHGIDLMLVAFFQSLVWMNPLYYWFARSVRENIEFLADQQVLRSGQDPKAYQYALLKVAQSSSLPLTQHFSISHLKKRIIMMNKKRTHSLWTSKYLLVVPLLIGTLLVVNAKELKDAWSNADFTEKNQSSDSVVSPDSTKQVQHEVIIIKHPGDSTHAEPLILIDGKKVTKAEMQQIDPETFSSVDVFKDSLAVSKFGDKGKNGVIVITSKKNIKTTFDKKGNVNRVIVVDPDRASKHAFVTTTINNKDTTTVKTIIIKKTGEQGSPLMILDGKVIESTINVVNPNNIESVVILKDSTAIKTYGKKGKNGVIIIKSKEK